MDEDFVLIPPEVVMDDEDSISSQPDVMMDEDCESTANDIKEVVNTTMTKLLPTKSRLKYEKAYECFKQWCVKNRKLGDVNEDILLAYFTELAKNKKCSSLWSTYSKLKSTLLLNENVNIKSYTSLLAFLKKQANGYSPKKSKVLNKQQIVDFLQQASDNDYLMIKVALIIAVAGACRCDELLNLTIDDIHQETSSLIVKIRTSKNNVQRVFPIINETSEVDYVELCNKYISLRPFQTSHRRFFIFYKNGKCTSQPVGKNKLGKLPYIIASFLNLPEANLYTGHCFRRTSATIMADAGASITTVKWHGGWRSNSVSEEYSQPAYENSDKPNENVNQMNGFSMLEPNQPEFKVGEKVTCLIKAERSHELRRQIERNHSDYHLNQIDYGHYPLTTSNSVDDRTLHSQDTASNISRAQSDGGHSTDTSSTSDRMLGPPSEDDLSGGKGSPVVRRNKSAHNKDTGAGQQQPVRLKQIPRSQRNSANLQSSTFQQDLLRLIHPDYMEPSELQAVQASALKESGSVYGKIPGNAGGSLSNLTSDSSSTLCSSDMNVENVKSRPHSPPTKDKPSTSQSQLETIVTVARPATVISNPSTASSPAPSEAKLSKEERLSPRVSKPGQSTSKGPLLLPDRQDMDWSSLVDTATRAMLHADLEPNDSTSTREEELTKHISQLESRLSRETRRRLSLEEEVRGLREENRRLQQESQSAAQQLRRFTEWFFQTIDKQ